MLILLLEFSKIISNKTKLETATLHHYKRVY